MKVIAVVGTKKTGKTSLVTRLVQSLKIHGKVGTIKNMPHHSFKDEGDTKRHFDAGADVVVGVAKDQVQFKVEREGGLESALKELRFSRVDFAIVEGFKRCDLPKIVLGEIEVSNCLFRVEKSHFDDDLVKKLTDIILSLDDTD